MQWHEKYVKSFDERSMYLAAIGKFLIMFSLGSIFSIKLVQYGYFILIFSSLIVASYGLRVYLARINQKKLDYSIHVVGIIGVFLLLLFLGIQTPQLLYKNYVLIAGILLMIPAIIELWRKK